MGMRRLVLNGQIYRELVFAVSNNNRNASGALEVAAAAATQNIQIQELNRCTEYMVRILKKYLRAHGFKLIGRVPIRYVKTGREFR